MLSIVCQFPTFSPYIWVMLKYPHTYIYRHTYVWIVAHSGIYGPAIITFYFWEKKVVWLSYWKYIHDKQWIKASYNFVKCVSQNVSDHLHRHGDLWHFSGAQNHGSVLKEWSVIKDAIGNCEGGCHFCIITFKAMGLLYSATFIQWGHSMKQDRDCCFLIR